MTFINQIFLEVTNGCNASCITCSNRIMKRKKGIMDYKLFEKLIDDIVVNRKTDMVHLYGLGEPYLVSDYLDYCNYAIPKLNDAKIESVIITNGEVITTIPKGLTTINISFNAGKKETYQKITGLDFDRTLYNIYRLADEKQFSHVRNKEIHMLVFEDNQKEVELFIKLFEPLKKYGVKLRLAYKYDNHLGLVKDKTLDIYKTNQRYPCHYLFNVLSICWDGQVIPCCHDFNGSISFGNAGDSPVDQLLQSKVRKEMLLKHNKGVYDGICAHCNFNIAFDGKYLYA